jgi:hypothetical protein
MLSIQYQDASKLQQGYISTYAGSFDLSDQSRKDEIKSKY